MSKKAEYNKKWAKEHRKELKEYQRIWRLKNLEKCRRYARECYYRNGGSLHKNSTFKVRYRKLRDVALRKYKSFDISYEQYLSFVTKPCFYCKSDLKEERGYSIDRIDNSKCYTLNNIVQCCSHCNLMRGDKITHEEMVVAMDAILKFRLDITIHAVAQEMLGDTYEMVR